VAEKLTPMENMKYFTSRPKESQLAAIVSKQSSRISARGVLEGKFLELKQMFAKGEIPMPTFWGGFRVKLMLPFSFYGQPFLHHGLVTKPCQNIWKAPS
jgi:pyridoxine/pyridoxamine 5'-phosphate oxidase